MAAFVIGGFLWKWCSEISEYLLLKIKDDEKSLLTKQFKHFLRQHKVFYNGSKLTRAQLADSVAVYRFGVLSQQSLPIYVVLMSWYQLLLEFSADSVVINFLKDILKEKTYFR